MPDQRDMQTPPAKLDSFGVEESDKYTFARKIDPNPGEDGVELRGLRAGQNGT